MLFLLLWFSFQYNEAPTEYTLYAPVRSEITYLVNNEGDVVHQWKANTKTGHEALLMKDGALLRTGKLEHPLFGGGGQGGRLEILEADGAVRWRWDCAQKYLQHHDIELMPNGNILLIAWEGKTSQEAIALGRESTSVADDGLWPDCLLEVTPILPDKHKVVWEWHSWDHLIQDRDKKKANFGKPSEHPGRVNVNYGAHDPRKREEVLEEMRKLVELGYIDGGLLEEEENRPIEKPRIKADWMHTNAVSYNAERDWIALSLRNFSEVWVIDHSTTSAEAATSKGGKSGRGGNILWRWGNPEVYDRGNQESRQLFGQHDVRWIPKGQKGAGNLTVFNNGEGRGWSSVDELILPVAAIGFSKIPVRNPWGPTKASWTYSASDKRSFFSGHISGANRLPNGNTLIAAGEQGRIFEVTLAGKTVWEHQVPKERLGNTAKAPRGPPRGPPRGQRGGRGGPGQGGLWRAYRYTEEHSGIQALLGDKK
jgi:hypothetical protein